WRAILPVSSVSLRPAQSRETDFTSNIHLTPDAEAGALRRVRTSQRRIPLRFVVPLLLRGGARGGVKLDVSDLSARACANLSPEEVHPAPRPPPLKRRGRICALAAQTQLFDDRLVAGDIAVLQIVEQPAALTDHLQKALARVVVFLVGLEVLGQVGDALGEDRNLNFRRTSVALALRVVFNERGFALCGHRHRYSF